MLERRRRVVLLSVALVACGARTEGEDPAVRPRAYDVNAPPPSASTGGGGSGGAAGGAPSTPNCVPGVTPGGGTQLLCFSSPTCPPLTDPSLFTKLASSLCKPGCILSGPFTNTGPGACCYQATLVCN